MQSEDIAFLLNTFIGLFVIIDPFAILPVYLSLAERFTPEQRKQTCLKASFFGFLIICGFAAAGLSIFSFFGITLPAFQIAGGLLLLRLGIDQLTHNRERLQDEEEAEGNDNEDISVFPLALPLLAGPGAISTVVLYSSKAKDTSHLVGLYGAIVAVFVSTYILLRLGPSVLKFLGQTGLNLMTRIMGILLTAIGVQFVINGIKAAF